MKRWFLVVVAVLIAIFFIFTSKRTDKTQTNSADDTIQQTPETQSPSFKSAYDTGASAARLAPSYSSPQPAPPPPAVSALPPQQPKPVANRDHEDPEEKSIERIRSDTFLWVNKDNKLSDQRFNVAFAKEFYGTYSGSMKYRLPEDAAWKNIDPRTDVLDEIEISFSDFEHGTSANTMLLKHIAPPTSYPEFRVTFALRNVGTSASEKALNVVIPHWLMQHRISYLGFKLPLDLLNSEAPLPVLLFGLDHDLKWKRLGVITLEKSR